VGGVHFWLQTLCYDGCVWWLMLIYYERKELLFGWWLVIGADLV
jgi:hypothetical protein